MYLKEALDDLYVCATNAKNATLEEGYYEKCYDRIIEEIEKQDTEINKLKRALDEMANTLDLNLSLSIENYKFGKKEKIKEYFMKERRGEYE